MINKYFLILLNYLKLRFALIVNFLKKVHLMQ